MGIKFGMFPTRRNQMSEFASYNPATGEKIWEGTAASVADVAAAVSLARKTFFTWSALSVEERMKFLQAFAAVLNARKSTLAEAISKETGKPLWESKSEVGSMINKVAISIEAYHQRCPITVKELPAHRSITRHKPHGVLAVLGPFNFPGHLPNGHIIPALLAGNTIIFKPSELTPLVAELTIQCWKESGLPNGVINLVQGGHETGKQVAENTEIDGLLFTGSWLTGQRLAKQLASTPNKILALEMGGNNPYIVSTISDPAAAAYLTVQSAYLTAGQRCTCARRLIVPIGQKGDQFIEHLVTTIQSIQIGPYTDQPEPFMGPVITATTAQRFLHIQENLEKSGGISFHKMEQLKEKTGLLTPGLMDVTHVLNRPDEEIFGPFLQLIRVKNFVDAIAEANKTSYGLAAGLLSDDENEYQLFYQQIRAGILNWNAQLTGASSSAPFGGIGKSGNHRPSGLYAADYCAYPVASFESNKLVMPANLTPGIKR